MTLALNFYKPAEMNQKLTSQPEQPLAAPAAAQAVPEFAAAPVVDNPRLALFKNLTTDQLMHGVIMAEVLGKPVSRRPRRR